MANKDTQSRKWLLTINNPLDKGFTHDEIKRIVSEIKSVSYWCMADEVGLKTQTPHTHIFLYSSGGIRFSTLKKRFPPADLEMSRGSALQNMEYVSKTGKWENDKKSDTTVDGTFYEFGEMPVERQGARNDLADLYGMIKSGMSDYEILEGMPDALVRLDHINRTRQTINQENFKSLSRELKVVYIFGPGGLGKTRSVMDAYGYSKVYRVTDYDHPFDNYAGEDVILFDEFHSQIGLELMNHLLDRYPLQLPCRYVNKWACYTKVYIIANISLNDQYKEYQKLYYDSWLSFLRRITEVRQFDYDGISLYDMDMVRNGWHLNFRSKVPFDQEVCNA